MTSPPASAPQLRPDARPTRPRLPHRLPRRLPSLASPCKHRLFLPGNDSVVLRIAIASGPSARAELQLSRIAFRQTRADLVATRRVERFRRKRCILARGVIAMDHETIELAFVIVAAAAIVLQLIIMLGMFLALRKATSKMQSDFEQLKNSVTPVIESAVPILKSAGPMVETARGLVTRLAPKLESAGNDLAATAQGVREQTAALNEAT